MNGSMQNKRSAVKFYLLVLALSIPFWLFGAFAGFLSKELPMNLPVSSLMTFCPLLAAAILVYREEKSEGIKKFFKSVFKIRGMKKLWLLPTLFLMPAVLLLSYWVMVFLKMPLPKPHIPILTIPVFLIEFFIAAVGEEAGWSGYVLERFSGRWSALKTGVVMGAIWGIWHTIPYIQAGHGLSWIVWQCLFSVAARVLIIWLLNNNGKCVLAAVFFHAMINVSDTLFPNNGSNYSPAVTAIITMIVTGIVILLWGSKTLSRFRYAADKRQIAQPYKP